MRVLTRAAYWLLNVASMCAWCVDTLRLPSARFAFRLANELSVSSIGAGNAPCSRQVPSSSAETLPLST